jgi:cysteine desulfurase NifS
LEKLNVQNHEMLPPVYLDYNATTPVDPQVLIAMRPYLEDFFGNPSSGHFYGALARQGVEKARRQTAEMLGCRPKEVIFTSGGTESNNLAIKGAAFALREKGNHIITSPIEHPSVLEVCGWLESQGFRITLVGVDKNGRVDPDDVARALTPSTILISVMHANNEVGTIQPIREIAAIAHSHNILMHTDAAQSVGKVPVGVGDLGVDLLTVAGHKLYAPKGVGALYVCAGTLLEKVSHGAGHEFNLRPGTENVAGIVGLGEACRLVADNIDDYQARMRAMRDMLEKRLLREFPEARVNAADAMRLPNTSSISFPGKEANVIVASSVQVAVSAGAACHAGDVQISHVLMAMGVPQKYAMGTIRFSMGRQTSGAEIERASAAFRAAVKKTKVV